MTCTGLLYFAFFILLNISTLSDSKHTNMTSFVHKRQASGEVDELEGPSNPCWKFSVGYDSLMEFYSPLYPDKYPNRIDCLKVITAPEGKIIRLDFRDQFHLESDDKCSFDYLEVRDGQHGYSYQIGKYCGDTFPDMITSSDRFLWLRFHSDSSIVYTGFKAVYTFIDKPGDSKHTNLTSFVHKRQAPDEVEEMEDPSNPCWKFSVGYDSLMEFYSPLYPDNYPSRIDCLKVIEAPEGKIIRLDFRDQFQLESDDKCSFDYLEVRDGQHGYSYQIGKYCGDAFPDMITSSDRFLWLRFQSDESIEYTGFKAVYTFIDKPGSV